MIGRARLDPEGPVVAASVGDWTIVYTVGRYCFDDGGALRLSWRFASDWLDPQTTDPSSPSFLAVTTDGGARLISRYEPRGNVRPWMKTVDVRVIDGFLREGEMIRFAWRRTRAQTFRETRFRFRLLVDPFGTGVFEEVPDDLGFRVISGPPARMRVHAPSLAARGATIPLRAQYEDAWGNPTRPPPGQIEVVGRISTWNFAVKQDVVEVPASNAGIVRAEIVHPASGLRATANPTEVVGTPTAFRPFWGDLHGQSGETIGSGTVAEYFAYARDVAAVDFASHQGNDFQVTPAVWDAIRTQTRAYHAPGRFVTFLGIEWSAITAAGGDHNVLYPGDDGKLHRTSHWQIADRGDAEADAYPISELHRSFADQNVLLVPHIGGRRADLTEHDPTLERLIEIHSCWGTFEWFLEDAMRRGYRVGFVAGSDDHKGRPGAASPGAGSFAVRGGLTCAWATDLTRPAIWDALRSRRTSCTTGARIIARLTTTDGRWMGEDIDASTSIPTFSAFVAGTASLVDLEIRRGVDVVCRHNLGARPSPDRIRIAWSGARIFDRNRQQTWDGRLRVDGGLILSATPYAMDEPSEVVALEHDGRVAWRSRTAGDEDGVDLTLDDARSGTLHFETEVCSFVLDLASLGSRHTVEAGGVDRRVVVSRLPESPGPTEVAFTWRDPAPPSGWSAYYLRAKQIDGEIAWTSPIFVHAP